MRLLLLCLFLTPAMAQTPCGQWDPTHTNWRRCPTWDKEFTAYTAALWATTILDVESTQRALNRGGRELNPIFGERPNRGSLYAVMAPINVGMMWWSYRMKSKGKKWWMLPMVGPTVGHGVAAGFNFRF